MKSVLFVLVSIALLQGCGGDDGGSGGVRLVDYEELKSWIVNKEDMALVDVRKRNEFDGGHLQDAINIDMEDLVDQSGNLIDDGAALTSVVTDKSKKLVAYCFGYGKDKDFADLAVSLGYKDVWRYQWGTNDWADQGDYFVIEYQAFLNWHTNKHPFDDGENYLVDVLPVAWYSGEDPSNPGGHIPGAVNVPIEEFADSEGNLIDGGSAFSSVFANREAVLVIYCGNWSCGKSQVATQAAVDMDYVRAYRYQGGWQEWQDMGNELKPGLDP